MKMIKNNKKQFISIISLILLTFSVELNSQMIDIVGKKESPQYKILSFINKTGIKIKECLKNKKNQKEIDQILHYKYGKKTFSLKECKFLGDCSWWATEILKETYPELYDKMKSLAETGNPVFRAYVWFHMFNNIAKANKEKSIDDQNIWVLKTTPDEIKQALIKNEINNEKIIKRVKSYKKKYDFYKKMYSNEWQKTISKISKYWETETQIRNAIPGDFLAVAYKLDQEKIKKGKHESTGHSIQIIKNYGQVKTNIWHPLNLFYKTYKFQVTDSTSKARKLDEIIAPRPTTGIGIRTLFIKVNRFTGRYAGWKNVYDNEKLKLNSFWWLIKGWWHEKGDGIIGRIK